MLIILQRTSAAPVLHVIFTQSNSCHVKVHGVGTEVTFSTLQPRRFTLLIHFDGSLQYVATKAVKTCGNIYKCSLHERYESIIKLSRKFYFTYIVCRVSTDTAPSVRFLLKKTTVLTVSRLFRYFEMFFAMKQSFLLDALFMFWVCTLILPLLGPHTVSLCLVSLHLILLEGLDFLIPGISKRNTLATQRQT
jgi:hypothetical protein